MHKYSKALTVLFFFLGLFLWLGGDETYFHESGGVGLVILVIGTPLMAMLAVLSNRTAADKKSKNSSANPLKTGVGLFVLGVLIYGSAFISGQGLGGIYTAFLGGIIAFIGIVCMVVGALRH